jgi:hypothetical protein
MPIKYNNRVDPIGAIENYPTINVAQYGSKHVTSYTSTFRVTAEVKEFLPSECACWAKREGLPHTAVTFVVVVITNQHHKLIKTSDPFILHNLGSEDNSTKEMFASSSSEPKHSEMCIFCCSVDLW